jgi:hypothetical protein
LYKSVGNSLKEGNMGVEITKPQAQGFGYSIWCDEDGCDFSDKMLSKDGAKTLASEHVLSAHAPAPKTEIKRTYDLKAGDKLAFGAEVVAVARVIGTESDYAVTLRWEGFGNFGARIEKLETTWEVLV